MSSALASIRRVLRRPWRLPGAIKPRTSASTKETGRPAEGALEPPGSLTAEVSAVRVAQALGKGAISELRELRGLLEEVREAVAKGWGIVFARPNGGGALQVVAASAGACRDFGGPLVGRAVSEMIYYQRDKDSHLEAVAGATGAKSAYIGERLPQTARDVTTGQPFAVEMTVRRFPAFNGRPAEYVAIIRKARQE